MSVRKETILTAFASLWRTRTWLLCCMLVFALSAQAQNVTFTFENGTITGTSTKSYEFDVMVQASQTGTRLGDSQVYVNYNSGAFGESVFANSKVTVTKGALISGNAFYDNLVVNDNTTSRFSIVLLYLLPNSPALAVETPTTPTAVFHVKIEIADQNQTTGLSFDSALMAGQQFQSDNSTTYPSVTSSDTDDISLPVELTAFDALVNGDAVRLNWETATETNNAGFDIEHALAGEIPKFSSIGFITGAGSTLEAQQYAFEVDGLAPGNHLFRLKQIDFDGGFAYSDPVALEIAGSFVLRPAYPNPFNPTTRISYDVPTSASVTVHVYDVLGRSVQTLVDSVQDAGRYDVTFDATGLASGIYYYRMEAGAFTDTRQMLLVK